MSDADAMLGGDAAATTTTAEPDAAAIASAAAATAATTTTAAAVPAWTDGLDDDAKKFIETKGYKSPADALAELRANAAPDSPDKYDIPVPEGEDPAFAKAVAPLMHKAGLSAAQAKALAEGWNELQTASKAAASQAQEAADRDRAALIERQKGELKNEWGQSFDANSEHVRRAWSLGAAAAGIPAEKMSEAVDRLGDLVGFPAALKLFAFYGGHFAEDTAHGLGGNTPPIVPSVGTRLYDVSAMNP